jgi:uncharacterized protein YggE
VLGRAQSGVRFGLSDCGPALMPLRERALAKTREDAEAFAGLASLTLGPIIAASESRMSQFYGPYGPAGPDPCNPEAAIPLAGPVPNSLLPFDAAPEVQLDLSMTVTYGLADVEGRGVGLSATGVGSATARADEAYVIVAIEQRYGPSGPEPLSRDQRDEVIEKLRDLDIDEDDIEIESPFFSGQMVVSVDVALDRLPDIGEEIVDAVEDVLGRSNVQGVVFSHTNCQAVLAEARKQAFGDASARAEALAGTAGVTLGGLLSIADSGPPPSPYGPQEMPCSEDLARRISLGGPYQGDVKPFDAEAVMTVSTTVSAVYAIEP